MKSRVLTALSALLLSLVLPGQSLLTDLRPGGDRSASSTPDGFIELNGQLLFTAENEFGRELWRSNGQPGSAELVLDINDGPASSDPEGFLRLGSQVFFTARLVETGRELWVTDGTAAGTQLLRDIVPGAGTSELSWMTEFRGQLFFLARQASTGWELWRSDGTPAGTERVIDLMPGTISGVSGPLVVWRDYLWFAGEVPGVGRELCRSDGTTAGTGLFADLWPGPNPSFPKNMALSGVGLFFIADGGTGSGEELWVSDGTVAGTREVVDLYPGIGGQGFATIRGLASGVIFEANDGTTGREPFFSDGTASGTVLLADINPGSLSGRMLRATVVNDSLMLFRGETSIGGGEPWRSDGTPAGTFQLADVFAGTRSSLAEGFLPLPPGRPEVAAFWADSDTLGVEVFVTDGTVAGTRVLVDLVPGPGNGAGSSPGLLGDTVVCGADAPVVGSGPALGVELYRSNAQLNDLLLVADVAQAPFGSAPAGFRRAAGGVVFAATDDNGNRRLVVSDGSGAGTVPLGSLGNPEGLTEWNGVVYGRATSPAAGRNLLRTDGTATGTAVIDLGGTQAGEPRGFRASQGLLYFAADIGNGIEPFVTDGSVSGTRQLAELHAGAPGSMPQGFTPAGSVTVFRAEEANLGAELYVTDGTLGGTLLLRDLAVGGTSSDPRGFVAQAGRAWFSAESPLHGRELWVTDGTASGTRMVSDVLPGGMGSSPDQITPLGSSRVAFVAGGPTTGRELYVSDGTAAGTQLLGEVVAGPGDGEIGELLAIGELLLFVADDGPHGRELWVADAGGLRMVTDLRPGQANGVVPFGLQRLGGSDLVVFVGSDGRAGRQLFISDGTAAGARQLGKIGPWAGAGAASLGELVVLGDELWFACNDGLAGTEPWRMRVDFFAQARSYGTGCAGGSGRVPSIGTVGQPRIGDAGFGITLSNGRPSSACALNLALAPTSLPLGGCRLLVAPPVIALPVTSSDAQGAAFSPIPLPTDPGLQGLALYGQWLVLDPGGALLGLGALSDGVELRVGY